MARKPRPKTTPAVPEPIDPDARYAVQLTRMVQLGPIKHFPRDVPIMTGKRLQRIIDQEGRDVIATANLRE